MNFLKIETDIELKEIYNESLCLYQNNNDWKINVLFYLSNKIELEKKWNNISSSVSAIYQSDLLLEENEFEKWNLYIIYVCQDQVSKELKNKIENDKFSTRKIVEDEFVGELTDETVNEFIVKHITNTDLKSLVKNTIETTESDYKPIEQRIWNIIPKDKLISGDTRLQKKLLEQIQTIQNEN